MLSTTILGGAAAIGLPTSQALAACSTSGADPVTVTCAANTSTTNTTNNVSPNASTVDRIQSFNADLIGVVNAGVTVNTFGLNLVTTKVNGGINFTNNGIVTGPGIGVVLQLDGNGGAVSYSGSGSVTGTAANANGLQIANAGTITVNMTGGSIFANGNTTTALSAFESGTGGTNITTAAGTLIQVNGTFAGSPGKGISVQNNGASGNIVIDSSSTFTFSGNGLVTAIQAIQINSGNITITSRGTIDTTGTLQNGNGIYAQNQAPAGNITLTANANITAGLGFVGLWAQFNGAGTGAASVTVANGVTVIGGNAVLIDQGTNGNHQVTTGIGSTLTGTNGPGIRVSGTTANLTLINAGAVSSTAAGTGDAVSVTGNVILNNTTTGSIAAAAGVFSGITAGGNVSGTNAGSITGNVGITATGPGSNLINAGVITGTGGTAILFTGAGNTLTLQNGTNITGLVNGGTNGTFQLGGTTGTPSFNVASLGVQYINFSTFNKVDAGTWTLTGNNTTRNWTVQAGTLTVGVGANVGIMTVTGGTLNGTGTVAGLIMNGGNVAPGNSIGTLNVAGNVSFGAGSTYLVEVNAAGQSDKIVATGVATLTGGTVTVLPLGPQGGYAASTQYTILSAAGGLGGTTFAGVNPLAFFTTTLSYPNANDVVLTLNVGSPGGGGGGPPGGGGLPAGLFASVATTPNQTNVANALQAAGAGALFDAILFQSAPGARQAFAALSGEIHASTRTALLDDSGFFRNAILGRLRSAGYAGATGDMGALGFGGPVLAYQMPVKAPPLAAPAPGPDLTFWAQGYGAWGRFDGDGNASSVKRSQGGVFTGVDSRFGEFWRLGVAAGYSRSNIDVNALASSASVDSFHVGGYAGARFGAVSLRAGATFAWHDIDTSRTIMFPGFFNNATASYHGSTAQAFGEVGYGMAAGNIAFEPFAGLAWVRVHTNSFAEVDGIAALNGASNSHDIGYSTLGLRVATTCLLPNGMILIPRASAAWQHAFGDVTPDAVLAFQSTGIAFGVAGVPLARDAAIVEAGLDLRLSASATFGVSYAGQLADHVQDHGVKGKFVWNF